MTGGEPPLAIKILGKPRILRAVVCWGVGDYSATWILFIIRLVCFADFAAERNECNGNA